MAVAFSQLEFDGGKNGGSIQSFRTLSNDMGVLFISWPVIGAGPGARVAGLHGSAGF